MTWVSPSFESGKLRRRSHFRVLPTQKGFANLLIGLFGAVRNPLAHAPKTNWPMSEQDALDILTLVSLIHRKLDGTTKLAAVSP